MSDSVLDKKLVVTSENGTQWAIPIRAIAINRATSYAPEFGGNVDRSLAEDTLPLFEQDDYEIWDWLAGNMNSDECVGAEIVAEPIPSSLAEAIRECTEYKIIGEELEQ